METLRSAQKWVKAKWDICAAPFRRFSTWAGGEPEKRNLFGWYLDFKWAIITLPFKVVYGIGVFLHMLFTEPAKSMKLIQFQLGRFGKACGALLHVGRVDMRTGQFDMDWDRILLLVLAWFWGGFLLAMLAAVGLKMLAVGIALAFVVGFFGSGIPGAAAVWNETTFEDWMGKRQERADEGQTRVIKDRIKTSQNLKKLAHEKERAAEEWENIKALQDGSMADSKEAGRLIEEAKAAAKAPKGRLTVKGAAPRDFDKEREEADKAFEQAMGAKRDVDAEAVDDDLTGTIYSEYSEEEMKIKKEANEAYDKAYDSFLRGSSMEVVRPAAAAAEQAVWAKYGLVKPHVNGDGKFVNSKGEVT